LSITGRQIAMPRAQYFVTQRNGEWKIRAGYRYSGPYPTKQEALQARQSTLPSAAAGLESSDPRVSMG
jgi:hypothetical protein